MESKHKFWQANTFFLILGVFLCYLTSLWENDFKWMAAAGLPYMVSAALLLYGRAKKSARSKAVQLFVFNLLISAYALAYFAIKLAFGQNLYHLRGWLVAQLIVPAGVILMMDAVTLSRARKRKKAEEAARQERAEAHLRLQAAERYPEGAETPSPPKGPAPDAGQGQADGPKE